MAQPLLFKEVPAVTATLMMAITHHEVRRHPRWREEVGHPATPSRRASIPGLRGFLVVGTVLLVAAIIVALLR